MLNVPEFMWDIWESGDFTGNNAPTTRASISRKVLSSVVDSGANSQWRTLLFSDSGLGPSFEIPNIQTVTIDRRVGTDAAQLTLTFVNQLPLFVDDNLDEPHDAGGFGPTRRELGDLGKPGYYTNKRGLATDGDNVNPWSHEVNDGWVNMFIPNRLIHVYQGYGTDGSGLPDQDTRLSRTGIFLIDDVKWGADGLVTVMGRDLSKLLIEQRLYPPIVPLEHYPLEFCASYFIENTTTRTIGQVSVVSTPEEVGPNRATHIATYPDSSAAHWYGYNASVYGHRASHAFDGNETTYWLSMGNTEPSAGYSYEWIGATTGGNPINRIRFKPKWGGYKCYVGVRVGNTWQGSATVPYNSSSPAAAPNGSNIRYVKQLSIPNNENWVTIDLPATYNAAEIRLVFTDLANSGLGTSLSTSVYRAAVYELQAMLFTAGTQQTIDETEEFEETVLVPVTGNISDYTDIVKLLAAWSGFHWPMPNGGYHDPLLRYWSNGSNSGRVWGDFFYSGAYPVEPPCIPSSQWDNKSVMDAINEIREMLGFVFYIDETGGIVWRPPNIWKTGNFVTGVGYVNAGSVRTVSEEKVLIQYDATISDASLRSDYIVVSSEDPTIYGAYRPYSMGTGTAGVDETVDLLGGQERVALIADFPFASQREVDKFAYLISLWSHWAYRKSKWRIPGMPAFMPDDQVRIYERTTSETYIHYIEGINSTMDMNNGSWYMDIDSHWLGNGPESEWLISYTDMHPALFAYLQSIGALPDDLDPTSFPDDWFTYTYPDIPTDPIRTDVDVDELIGTLPDLVWPDPTQDSESEGGVGATASPSGTAFNCSNSAKFQYWGAGPYASQPGTSPSCNGSTMGGLQVAVKWQSSFSSNPPWNSNPNQTSTLAVNLDRRAHAAYRELVKIMMEEGFNIKQVGGYSCRGVRLTSGSLSTTTWSNHAWGLAMDVNWNDYPYLRRTSDPVMLRIIRRAEDEIWTNSGQRVFRNGNTWPNADPMHFEVCCTPSDLASGIRTTSGIRPD